MSNLGRLCYSFEHLKHWIIAVLLIKTETHNILIRFLFFLFFVIHWLSSSGETKIIKCYYANIIKYMFSPWDNKSFLVHCCCTKSTKKDLIAAEIQFQKNRNTIIVEFQSNRNPQLLGLLFFQVLFHPQLDFSE